MQADTYKMSRLVAGPSGSHALPCRAPTSSEAHSGPRQPRVGCGYPATTWVFPGRFNMAFKGHLLPAARVRLRGFYQHSA